MKSTKHLIYFVIYDLGLYKNDQCRAINYKKGCFLAELLAEKRKRLKEGVKYEDATRF